MKLFWLLSLVLAPVFAQEPVTAPAPTPIATPVAVPNFDSISEELTSLDALNESIDRRERARDKLYQQMQAAKDPMQREALLPKLEKLNEEIKELHRRFQTIALKTDIGLFVDEPKEEFDPQKKLLEIAEPLFDMLEEATRESRELSDLKDGLQLNQEKRATAREAVKSLEDLLQAEPDPKLRERLTRLQEVWTGHLQDAENQVTFYQLQLKQREKDKQSLVEQSGQFAKSFVRTRGMNLLIGVLSFAAVFFGMRYLQVAWSKFRPSKKKGRSFSSRLTTLVWTLLTVVLSVGALLAAFNATGDIFLLSLTMIFLIGVGWAGAKALPAFMEQIRMMLNMGAVREDEVLIYEGLSWKVNHISFRTELVNPSLDGGVLTLPTRLLVGMVSRPAGENEEWFPSRDRDWVVLKDGTFGRVSYQTPTGVQVVGLGGAQTVYPTQDYLALSPTVLSTGFRREVTFDLDYRHLPEITTSIPEKIRDAVNTALAQHLGDDLRHVSAQLAEAAASSLRVAVVIDCKGGAASHWPFIPMWTQAAIVDLAHREGWSIPFPQLQVHTNS